uniref:Uncharacterized protein n=1 Tax=Trichuris muris TaxID=70415 RepID=A0A5S6QKV4_TRIMR
MARSLPSVVALFVLCYFCAFIDSQELKNAKILASKSLLSSYAVERKELVISYSLYNIGDKAALDVELKDGNFLESQFRFVRGSANARWDRIPAGANVSHVLVVVPLEYGSINYTAATVTYRPNEESSIKKLGYTTSRGVDNVYTLKDYHRQFEQHYVEWLIFLLMVCPSLAAPAMLWIRNTWLVAALMEMFVAEGNAIEFFDARRIALVVRGTATLAGAVWETYLGSRGVQAIQALGLFRAMNPAGTTLERLWDPTNGHVAGWGCSSSFWSLRPESASPMYLLHNDVLTGWSEIWTSLTPHYEMKMVVEKFGLWRNGTWPMHVSSVRLSDDNYVTGISVKLASETMREDQLGKSLSAGYRVPRCLVFGFRGQARGEWIEVITFGAPWQLYDHCAYRSDTTIQHKRIMAFGIVAHPIRPPRSCLALS